MEVLVEHDMFRTIDHCFHGAMYYAARGFEQACQNRAIARPSSKLGLFFDRLRPSTECRRLFFVLSGALGVSFDPYFGATIDTRSHNDAAYESYHIAHCPALPRL